MPSPPRPVQSPRSAGSLRLQRHLPRYYSALRHSVGLGLLAQVSGGGQTKLSRLGGETNATDCFGVARVCVQSVERWIGLDENDGAGALLAGFLEVREHLVRLSQACINQWNRLRHVGAPPRKL